MIALLDRIIVDSVENKYNKLCTKCEREMWEGWDWFINRISLIRWFNFSAQHTHSHSFDMLKFSSPFSPAKFESRNVWLRTVSVCARVCKRKSVENWMTSYWFSAAASSCFEEKSFWIGRIQQLFSAAAAAVFSRRLCESLTFSLFPISNVEQEIDCIFVLHFLSTSTQLASENFRNQFSDFLGRGCSLCSSLTLGWWWDDAPFFSVFWLRIRLVHEI